MSKHPKLTKPDRRPDAFLEDPDGTTEVAGIHLRPMNLTTLMLMQRAKIGVLFGEKPADGYQQFFQICAFAWLLSENQSTVLAAFRKNQWREEVENFGVTIPVTSLPALLKEMERIGETVSAGLVDVLPDDEDGSERGVPGE